MFYHGAPYFLLAIVKGMIMRLCPGDSHIKALTKSLLVATAASFFAPAALGQTYEAITAPPTGTTMNWTCGTNNEPNNWTFGRTGDGDIEIVNHHKQYKHKSVYFKGLFLPTILKEYYSAKSGRWSLYGYEDDDLAKLQSIAAAPSPSKYKFNVQSGRYYGWQEFRVKAKVTKYIGYFGRELELIPLYLKYTNNNGWSREQTWYYSPLLSAPAYTEYKSGDSKLLHCTLVGYRAPGVDMAALFKPAPAAVKEAPVAAPAQTPVAVPAQTTTAVPAQTTTAAAAKPPPSQTATAAQQQRLVPLHLGNKHSVGVIIGNRRYADRTPEVSFAHNDADAMRDYLLNWQGYREGNIIDLRDATQAQLVAVFGNEKSHEGKLFNWVRAGKSNITVFYSGHGVPGSKDRRGYLLPVDADPNLAELNGYPVDTLFANLAKIEAKSVTVYLDACFSGDSPKGMIIRATSGISITPKMPAKTAGLTVLTAARGDQYASWDEDAKLGLFTKYLLAALHGAADGSDYGDGDGQISLSEVQTYLDDEMSYQARRRYGRRQNASVQGNPDTVLSLH